MIILNCLIGAERLLTPGGWEEGRVIEIRDGRIARIAAGTAADFHAAVLSPGLIDPHIHGGDGFDVMHPTEEGMAAWLAGLAEAGVAAVAASPYTAPPEVIRDSLESCRLFLEGKPNPWEVS